MKIEDYEEVYNLWINTPGMGLNSIDDSKQGISKFLKRNPNTSFIAKEDRVIIGAILCGHDGRRGYIYHTAVNPRYTNEGIGRSLVERAIDSMKEENISKVSFVVFDTNITGNEFWERLGFKKRDDLVYRDMVITSEELRRIDT